MNLMARVHVDKNKIRTLTAHYSLSQISILVTLCIMEVSRASGVLEESRAGALHCVSF